MDSTDGLQRGAKVVDNGAAISVPVGNDTLGRALSEADFIAVELDACSEVLASKIAP